MLKRIYLPALLLLFFSSSLFAQEPCGLDEITRNWINEDPSRAFELDQQYAEITRLAAEPQNTARAAIIVPCVVHVIHKGESVGTGTNVSDSRILSQLQILNDDFQRMNTDASNTPSQFVGSAASANIIFCLANQDPSGNVSSGITRHLYSNIQDVAFIEGTIKSQTTWNSNRYLNIWVVDIPDPSYLGYSYLPTSSMVGSSQDGLVVDYNRFGFISGNNRGRTATHEIGHYLGLRHMWGNNDINGNHIGCTSDDGIQDTPNSDEPYFSCPGSGTSCNSSDMFMNYMDYVDDNCMNMFTQGQANVMSGILNGIRSELVSSNITNCAEDCKTLTSADINHGFEPSQANSDWSILNANGDDRTWILLEDSDDDWGPNEGSGMAVYFWNSANAADDYLFTPCLEFKKNNKYSFSFSYACAEDQNALYPEKFNVGMSRTQSSGDFMIPNNDWIFSPVTNAYPNYKDAELTFVSNENKSASFGFHIFSDADQYALQIDDIKIKDLGPVASTDNPDENRLFIRPNPTTQIIFIDTPQVTSQNSVIQLFDTQGKLLRSEKPIIGQSTIQLDLLDLPAGVFLVKWSDGSNHWVQRVVKVSER